MWSTGPYRRRRARRRPRAPVRVTAEQAVGVAGLGRPLEGPVEDDHAEVVEVAGAAATSLSMNWATDSGSMVGQATPADAHRRVVRATSYPDPVILRLRRATTGLAVVALAGVAGCSSGDDTRVAPGHSHAGGVQVSLPVGDGTQASEVGYSLRGRAGAREAGRDRRGQVPHRGLRAAARVTDYVEELTKELHLYVVRDDLDGVPPPAPDAGRRRHVDRAADVPDAGDYRVIAEFVARRRGRQRRPRGPRRATRPAAGATRGTCWPPTGSSTSTVVAGTRRPGPNGRLRLRGPRRRGPAGASSTPTSAPTAT